MNSHQVWDLYSRDVILSPSLSVQSREKIRILHSYLLHRIKNPHQSIMLISWLNRLSLIDYPWHVACVVFTLGCNLRCGYCHNPDFVLPERIAKLKVSREEEKKFFDFLKARQWLLEWVSICGGEPTIHRDLGEFCSRIKSLGFKVKLDTNGHNPTMLRSLIEQELVDYIAMDIKHTWQKYHTITGVIEDMHPYQESASLLKSSHIEHEFRTTLIGGIHTPADIDGIGQVLSGAKQYFLQQYRTSNTLDPDFSGYSPDISMLYEWQSWLSLYNIDAIGIRV